MLRILKSIWKIIITIITFIIDTVRDFIEWLKRPESKLKFVCVILAMLLVILGLIAFAKEQEIKRLNALIVSNDIEYKTQINKRDDNIRSKDAAFAEIAAKLKLEQDKLDVFRELSAKELGVLREELQRLEMEESTWKQRYGNRPKECRAALELLDSACSSMEDY